MNNITILIKKDKIYVQYKKNINGILLLDKPQGISSNQALQKIKKIFYAKKAGYIGTLDPLATGVLPICFGESTKLSGYLTNSKKSYYVVARLGQITSTYDSEGVILENLDVNFTDIEFNSALNKLKGKIHQFVPIYSAIKYKGIPLYKYARNNVTTPPIKRTVYIYNVNCIKRSKTQIELEITCSKGTYIRSFIHDLGQYLSCGAHVISLRRTQVSLYNILDTVTFSKLYHLNRFYTGLQYYNTICNLLLPIKKIFFTLPEIKFNSSVEFNQKNKICPIPFQKPGVVRITIKHHKKMFIIGNIGTKGEFISYKLLNI